MYDILIDSQSLVPPTSCHCRPSLDIVISDTVSCIPYQIYRYQLPALIQSTVIENKKINS